MAQHLFPIPNSAKVAITPLSADVFNVDLAGLTNDDLKTLVGFFLQMQGRFQAFRFEHNGIIYPECRFESDTGPAMTNAPGPHSRTIPIRILRP